MELFDLVAMGGTFDAIHSGHMALLNKATRSNNSIKELCLKIDYSFSYTKKTENNTKNYKKCVLPNDQFF